MDIPLLTSGESRVYQALIELGDTSVGNVLKNSGVSHSKIYDILKRLSNKGLISSINRNGRQFFSATDPKYLTELVVQKENELNKTREEMTSVIQNLNYRKNVSKPVSIVGSYEGFNGMKLVLESLLNSLEKNEEILILGSPKRIGMLAGGYLKDWQKKRISLKLKCKIITDIDSTSWDEKWWQNSKKNGLTLTKKFTSVSPAYFVITNKKVATIYFSEVIISLIVEQAEIANRYRDFFNIIWKYN